MEQKQLDDDSYFGDEFVDEPIEEVRVEAARKPETKWSRENKSKESKAEKKIGLKTSESKNFLKPRPKMALIMPKAAKEPKNNKDVATATAAKSKDAVTKSRDAKSRDAPVGQEKSAMLEKAKPALTPNITTVSPDAQGGIQSEASTWKAITGIALVLLLISVFTQGFHFSDRASAGAKLSLTEAEQKTLAYVNANLLQAPFVAEVKNSEEVNDLFKITLSVADQEVDSYLTRDGKIFFPRGFELEKVTEAQEGEASSEDRATVGVASDAVAKVAAASETTENSTEPVVETRGAVSEASLTLQAKRWLFEPQYLKVKKGTRVHLTIEPTKVVFTFAFPAYNINKEVQEKTTLDFTAEKTGKFPFSCSSCEEWRGMKGVLEVEE